MSLSNELKQIIADDFNRESKKRARRNKVIYASAIGGDCRRKLWYDCHEPGQEEFSFQSAANMQSGNRAEDLMLTLLRRHPDIHIVETQSKPKGLPEHWGMKVDAIIEYQGEPMVWEHKDTSRKKFDELLKKGSLITWNMTYYTQAQIYMHFFNLQRCLFTVSTEGLRDFTHLFIDYAPTFAQDVVNKANMIRAMDTPPEVPYPSTFWLCKFCNYRDRCHGIAG
jgi:hypothetical protein